MPPKTEKLEGKRPDSRGGISFTLRHIGKKIYAIPKGLGALVEPRIVAHAHTDTAAERPDGGAFPSAGLQEQIRSLAEFVATASATDFAGPGWTVDRIVELSKTMNLNLH